MCPGAFEHLCRVFRPTEIARYDFGSLLVLSAATFQLFYGTSVWARQSFCARHAVRGARSRDINGPLHANTIRYLCGSQKDRGGTFWAFLAGLCPPIILVIACSTWCAIFSGRQSLGGSCWTKVTADFASSWLLPACRTFFAHIGATIVIVCEKLGVRAGKACLLRLDTEHAILDSKLP